MNMRKYLLVTALVLSGCATGWTPVIDNFSDTDPTLTAEDNLQCQQIAEQATGNTAGAAVDGALVGGLLGAAFGAAVGAVLGNPGEGAALGAAIWGVGGGVQNAAATAGGYRQIYANCMRGRGHNVLN